VIGLVVGKYRILEEIGRGAMGIVFKAQDEYLGRQVALKILAEKLADDPGMLQRFEREGGAASALCHPNICTVFDSGNWKGRPYLAMELLSGETLDTRLARGPLETPQLIAVAIGVSRALEAAHSIGVIHRDIKPANLFLTAAGLVKVLDFGLAKQKAPAAPVGDDAPTMAMATRMGMVVGTPAYMSPEQVCCEPVDGRSDLYSLGVTLYELATGELPGPWSRQGKEPAALPAGMGPVVQKLTERDAARRYQSAREAREAFERCAVEAPRAV